MRTSGCDLPPPPGIPTLTKLNYALPTPSLHIPEPPAPALLLGGVAPVGGGGGRFSSSHASCSGLKGGWAAVFSVFGGGVDMLFSVWPR